ncbi:hypothetical protein Kisp01_31840 [Kineosporia sp. NBRC 101677]|nr:hypothetical protein Kisp01_31840 [Kineosporia sp. NBRC 101677]
MTVSVEKRPERPAGRNSRWGLISVAIGVPVLALLVVAAGFIHPWNPGGGLADGRYTRDYSVRLPHEVTDAGACLDLTLAGTLSATYRSPAWSLGGPGWTSAQLSDVSLTVRSAERCGDDAPAVVLDTYDLSQFWATETCAEPIRGDWQESTPATGCESQDLVAGIGTRSTAPGAEYRNTFSGIEPLSWHGTVYGDSLCLNGAVSGTVNKESQTHTVALEGYRVCLDPTTAQPN